MNNDYDTRRSFEAAALAGDEDARKYAEEGFEGIEAAYGGFNALKDLKEKYGTGGGLSGAKNEAGLTQRIVDYERSEQTKQYESMFAPKDKQEAVSVDEQVAEANYEPSDKMKAAKERVANYNSNPFNDGDNEAQRTQAADSFSKYKLDLRRWT